MITVREVEARPEHYLALVFSDGSRGEVDLGPLLSRRAFESLKDEQVFAQVRIDHGAVRWPGDVDIATEALYALAHGLPYPETIEAAQANERTVKLRQAAARGYLEERVWRSSDEKFLAVLAKIAENPASPPMPGDDYLAQRGARSSRAKFHAVLDTIARNPDPTAPLLPGDEIPGYLQALARRGSREKFLAVLAKIPAGPPMPGDETPDGLPAARPQGECAPPPLDQWPVEHEESTAILKCECGGRRRRVVLARYDFSVYAGLPATLVDVPVYRCDKCTGVVLGGMLIGRALRSLVQCVLAGRYRLTAKKARFLRGSMLLTQEELAEKLGVTHAMVASWEAASWEGGEPISQEHELLLRSCVFAYMLRPTRGRDARDIVAPDLAHADAVEPVGDEWSQEFLDMLGSVDEDIPRLPQEPLRTSTLFDGWEDETGAVADPEAGIGPALAPIEDSDAVPLKRCPFCKEQPLTKITLPDRIKVAGHVFTTSLPALKCEACGESTIAFPDIARFEDAVARVLAERGQASGEAFRFLRKSLGLAATDIAPLFGTTRETLLGWETGEHPLDLLAWRALVLLVREASERPTEGLTMEHEPAEPRETPREHGP